MTEETLIDEAMVEKKERNGRAQGTRGGFRSRSPNLSSNPHLSNPSNI